MQDLEGTQDSVPNDLKKMLLISTPTKEVPILERGKLEKRLLSVSNITKM
jgi:hypothetical protein